jgi:catechol 2,3-dioxygenase-like lactoylglutathione lyase family enzyme
MKRMHVHVGVKNLDESVRFYSALFGAQPSKLRPDYAKWMLDDPHLNFAISTYSGTAGVDHFGLQVDDTAELDALRDQMSAANISTHSEGETTCCYARSEKSWVEDPDGVAWEAYHTMEDAQTYGLSRRESDAAWQTACCTPNAQQSPCCAPKPEVAASASCRGMEEG